MHTDMVGCRVAQLGCLQTEWRGNGNNSCGTAGMVTKVAGVTDQANRDHLMANIQILVLEGALKAWECRHKQMVEGS